MRNMKASSAMLCLREIDELFRPFTHRKLTMNTRLVMAPMSRSHSQAGAPAQELVQYYRLRASHLLGLILTEPVAVNDPAAAVDEDMAHFSGGPSLRLWKGICRAVHAFPCRIAPQLFHAGMLRKDDLAIGPSGIDPMTGKKRGEEMSRDRMGNVVNAFAQAAGLARVLGFDAVEICGGQGGLIDQFLRPETNHRSDEYGGSLLARTRFACDVLHAVRKMVGRKFPIIFRLSLQLPENPDARLVHTPEELSELLVPLCNAGVDIFAVDDSGTGAPFHGNALGFAGWVKMLSGRPVIIGEDAASNSPSLELLSRRLAAQEFDLVAIGRALLADAEWGRKVREARVNEIHGLV